MQNKSCNTLELHTQINNKVLGNEANAEKWFECLDKQRNFMN